MFMHHSGSNKNKAYSIDIQELQAIQNPNNK